LPLRRGGDLRRPRRPRRARARGRGTAAASGPRRRAAAGDARPACLPRRRGRPVSARVRDARPARRHVVSALEQGVPAGRRGDDGRRAGRLLGGRGVAEETQKERVDRELIELLNELRIALPGVQVMFAFLLTVPFTQRFEQLEDLSRDTYFATFICT